MNNKKDTVHDFYPNSDFNVSNECSVAPIVAAYRISSPGNMTGDFTNNRAYNIRNMKTLAIPKFLANIAEGMLWYYYYYNICIFLNLNVCSNSWKKAGMDAILVGVLIYQASVNIRDSVFYDFHGLLQQII